MAGSQSSFSWKTGTLLANAKALDSRANKAIAAATEYQATRSERWMKSNAKWNDQTGNARNSLSAVAYHEGTTHRLVLSHGVPYGIWLEVRFSGRYAVVMPAWLLAQVELKSLLAKLFDGIAGVS